LNDADRPADANHAVKHPRWYRKVWLVRYVKRKLDERKAEKQKETPTDRAARITANATFWIAVFTFVSVGVSVGTFLILRKQLNEMHDSGVDTHTLAEQALSQGTLLRQQIVGTFGAVIPNVHPGPQAIIDAELTHYQGISLTYVNIGKVKAKNFFAEATLIRQSLPSYKPIGIPVHKQTSKPEMIPSDQISPYESSDVAILRFDAKALTDPDITSLHELRETIEIAGYFQYNNGFGDTIREPFCFLYAVIPQHIFEKSGAGTGGGGPGGWFACEEARRIITQGLKWKQQQTKPN